MAGLLLTLGWLLVGQAPQVGARPYELDWAGRTKDDYPALVDFEHLDGWQVRTEDAVASFERSQEQRIWGDSVGKLTYRGTGNQPKVFIEPPQPIACPDGFDTLTLWIYGNNWAWVSSTDTPQVTINAHFLAADGSDIGVFLYRVNAMYWFVSYRKLTPDQAAKLARGAKFTGFEVTGGRNKEDRSIYLDSFSLFKEELKPLSFKPRPQRGIPMFPGEGVGVNTGEGKLPFPTRPETILPPNLTKGYRTSVKPDGDAFVLVYDGQDGKLTYRINPKRGSFDDITARWAGRGGEFAPCEGGGVYFVGQGNQAVPAEKTEHLGTKLAGDTVVSRWRLYVGEDSCETTYTYHLWGKSLVVDIQAPGGMVSEVRFGHAVGLDDPRVTQVPFYDYSPGRPHIAISGPADAPLFLMGNIDWYLSNASTVWGEGSVEKDGAHYNGGTRYTTKTDGKRNDVYDRFFITLSPNVQEVLPVIPNPTSPWKEVTGAGIWRAHGASNRENDAKHWRNMYRYGMRKLIITDHETGWRDAGESFTFRTRTAPGRGGDESQFKYARILQDELGFVYGPYNNYTDFAPVNEYWSADRVNRLPDGQLQTAWARCYAPKPQYATEFCELLAPKIEEKFGFSTAYCDVHTAVAPWHRTDYDARNPAGGTFAGTVYAYGEIMLLQKQAWGGPVYSEGNHHCYLHGLTDGNYGQDQNAHLPDNPWFVDFDLLRMHDLGCNFGMGAPSMFYGRRYNYGSTREAMDFSVDRFLAATIAFGHPGFLVSDGGYACTLRSYYMLQQLQTQYTLSSIDTIRYADANGKLLDSSTAVASGDFARCQVVNRYQNGTVTVVNGSKDDRLQTSLGDQQIDLPPAGYTGWNQDRSVYVLAGDVDGHRIDYAETPEYLYVDGRGQFTRMARAASDGLAICRRAEQGGWELIPYQNASAGFDLGGGATAVALDYDGQELGPTEVRVSRGLAYPTPVKDAFSYLLKPTGQPAVELTCVRTAVVAGEEVTIRGKQAHQVTIPADLKVGERYWHQAEGGWIDFTVAPLADTELALSGNALELTLASSLPHAADGTVTLDGRQQQVRLQPGRSEKVSIDLGEPTHESLRNVDTQIQLGKLTMHRRWVLRTVQSRPELADVPGRYRPGMRYRNQPEAGDFGTSHGYVATQADMSCGGELGTGLFMHPPYLGGVGYTFALLDPLTLPEKPPAAFRCRVGKKDGSDLGDGILFRVEVVSDGEATEVARQVVEQHEWLDLEADLSRWAGQTIQLKLIADVGEADDSSGDWACWSSLRIESLDLLLTREVSEDDARFATDPPPLPLAGLTLADLKTARAGKLHYDGLGLSGTGAYGSYAILNGVPLGNMAPAGGQEAEGIWAEDVTVGLTPEALATLGVRNQFVLDNSNQDYYKVRRFWLEVELADGRRASTRVATAVYTQPPGWLYFEGIGVPQGEQITIDLWFELGP